MSDDLETVYQLAADLRRLTERMNTSLAELERELFRKKFAPRTTVVVTHHERTKKPFTNIFGWDGRRFTWNGQTLLSSSRTARIAACENLNELFHGVLK